MYPFKIVITTVKMAKCKLHITFTKAHVYSDSAGTCHFYCVPGKVRELLMTLIAPQTRSKL